MIGEDELKAEMLRKQSVVIALFPRLNSFNMPPCLLDMDIRKLTNENLNLEGLCRERLTEINNQLGALIEGINNMIPEINLGFNN